MHRAVLRPGQRLPSSRQLAERIGVSRNTVSLAYDALLADGYLSSRSRSGVYVAADVAGTRIGGSRRRRDPESPLAARLAPEPEDSGFRRPQHRNSAVEGKNVSVRVDTGGGGRLKKKNIQQKKSQHKIS